MLDFPVGLTTVESGAVGSECCPIESVGIEVFEVDLALEGGPAEEEAEVEVVEETGPRREA